MSEGPIGLNGEINVGLNRRQTATLGGTATSYLYDGWDVAQEQQGGTPSADLILGLNLDERFGSTTALASAGAVQTSRCLRGDPADGLLG